MEGPPPLELRNGNPSFSPRTPEFDDCISLNGDLACHPSPPSEETPIETPSRKPLKLSISFRDDPHKNLERFYSTLSRFGTPDEEKSALFRVFNMFDKNHDGRLSIDEILGSLENLGVLMEREELNCLLNSDSDGGDGSLDIDGFRSLYRSIWQAESEGERTPGGKADDTDLQSAFDVFDKDHDGFISATELQSVLTSLGFKEGNDLAGCQKMISKVDSDGDGQVNMAEFRIMMSSMTDYHQ